MNYFEYKFTAQNTEEFKKDLLINSLSEIGFDTFMDTDGGFMAYIAEGIDPGQHLSEIISTSPFTFEIKTIPHQNWNEVWERNFEPLRISERCYVRATFHDPHLEYEFEIIIDPKMAFGTGHHQTTALMMELMMEEDFKGKTVLDMGCGTGILAILASHLGASEVLAVDYDPICFESTIENSSLNTVSNLKALCGSKEVIPAESFDIILANINRNILMDQIEKYTEVLSPSGIVFFSGFYEDPDLQIITEKSKTFQLMYTSHRTKDRWVATRFQASN